MGLEVATYIGGLTAAWPVSTDTKSQGDDHIRLVKAVLQGTFPNASKAFYFPLATAGAANVILAASDQNRLVSLSTAGGELTVSLPSLVSGDAGWMCEIIKTSTDTNGITVSPPSGTIVTQFGALATVRVGVVCSIAKFIWNGSNWLCSKSGPMVGSTINFDSTTVPAGHMVLDGSVFSGTVFAELAAALGATTLRDKRGRVEAGIDTGGLRLTSSVNGFGGVASLGSVSGAEGYTLDLTKIPPHQHDVFLKEVAHGHGLTNGTNVLNSSFGGNTWPGGTGGGTATLSIQTALTNMTIGSVNGVANDNKTASIGGTSGAAVQQKTLPPIFVTNKIIRAC